MSNQTVESREQLKERVAGKARSEAGSPLEAVRYRCLQCAGGSYKEVRLCPDPGCALWLFRFGKKPETTAKHGLPIDPQDPRLALS